MQSFFLVLQSMLNGIQTKPDSYDSLLDTTFIHSVCCYLSLFLVYSSHQFFICANSFCADQFYFSFKAGFHEIQLSIFLMLKYTVSTTGFPLHSNFVMKLKGNQSTFSDMGWLLQTHAVYC